MRRILLLSVAGVLAAGAQTLLDPAQLKRPVRAGTVLPAGCAVGDLFFKTDAARGANLYGCTAVNTWTVETGMAGQNCAYNATAQLLQCQDSQGNVFTPVKASGSTANQWVDSITAGGVAHTSQPTAAQVANAVDQTGNYTNPSWIGSLAWTKLSGVPLSFNAGQLQGRPLAATAPADLQYLGWNSVSGQWEPKTLAAAGVSSVFGRSGAVSGQNGDYSFAQIAGALGATQLPATAMQSNQSNAITAGTQDFTKAAHTLPMKSGAMAGRPGTCAVGETYFVTDAPAGSNLYACTGANTWTPEGGVVYSVASDGVPVASGPTLNFVTGLGLTNAVSSAGSEVNLEIGLDSAVVETQSDEQSGAPLLCASAGGSGSSYQCALNPTVAAYTAGMVLHWKPDVSGTGGTTTLNVDQLGALPVMLADGVSNPGATDIVGGHLYNIWYDGTNFRLMNASATASQIAGLAAVAVSGSYNDLSNKPVIPAAQVSADWNAISGVAQILHKPQVPAIASSTALLKGDGAGNAVAATPGTDYLTASSSISPAQLPAPGTSSMGGIQAKDCTGAGHVLKIGTDGSVTCSADSGTSGAGVIGATTHVLKGDGGGNAVAATAGADYVAPGTATNFTAAQSFNGSASLGASYLSTTKTAGAGGVTANKLCKIDATGNVSMPAAGDGNVLGVCVSTAASGSAVEVATRGIVNCVADNATAVGDIAIVGTVSAGSCADANQASAAAVSAGTQIIGKMLTGVSAGQLAAIQLYGPGHYGTKVTAIQGNAVSAAAPADGQVLQWSQSNNQYQPAIAAGCAISGGAAYWAPFAPVAAGSYAVSGGSSTVNVFLIVPQCTVKFSNVAFDVTAANSSSCTGGACGLAVGIYDAAGNKISQAVAVQGGSPDINSTGYKNLSWGSTVTLNAGTAYYLATASDSATLGVLKVDQTNSQQLENILNAYTTLVSVGQAANHSTGDGASLALPASLGSITAAVSLYTIPPVIVLR